MGDVRRTTVALLTGLALVAAACGSDSSTTPTTSAPTTSTSGTAAAPGGTGAPGAAGAMTITYEINPAAVWDDGSPITVKDFQCLAEATMGTTETLSTAGYDQITSVEQGANEREVIVTLKSVYAPYKNLFSNPGPLKAAAFPNGCSDLSAEMQSSIPFASRPYKMASWSPDQSVLVANDAYWGDDVAKTPKVVMVPLTDTETELTALRSGEVGFIFPQASNGVADALKDPNIATSAGLGSSYEAFWFQQQTGPFADAAFRRGFAHLIDRAAMLQNVYDPLFPGASLLDCGLWVPSIGTWCDPSDFATYQDPAAGEAALTAGGWAKNDDGMWEKDGEVPTIRWMADAGNKRREDAQALMIPLFKAAGFDVVADNCDAACVFQKRLPAMDYDLGMFVQSASPDPTVTSILACDAIPSDANDGAGQNTAGWCNQAATDLMYESDQELDPTERLEQIHEIGRYVADDAVLVPLY